MAMAGAAIGGITSLFGSVAQASGAMGAAKAQSMTNRFMSEQALFNAEVAKKNADYSRKQGEAEAMSYGLGASARMGQIKVAQAASGFDINTGSPVLIRQSQQLVSNIDMDRIRSNAAKTAYNYNVEAVQYENQAKLYKMASENASAAGKIGAASAIIGGIGSVASQWFQAMKFGSFNFNSPSLGSS